MKKLCTLLTVALLLFCFSACSKLDTNNKDTSNISENSPNVSGIALSNNATELELNTSTEDVTLTPDSLLTNSTKITVTADSIASGNEVEVFLYLSHDTEHYIATTTLTTAKSLLILQTSHLLKNIRSEQHSKTQTKKLLSKLQTDEHSSPVIAVLEPDA